MNNLLRGLIAGYGAKKLGGGCFGTILVFILIWVALGYCNGRPIEDRVKEQPKKRNQVTWVYPPDSNEAIHELKCA